jgi:WhiB family transcriptional regulator, redox-sensing transcriptional regulator
MTTTGTREARPPVVQENAWSPEAGQRAELAKAICGTCPVQAPCLAYALARAEVRGIWGGLSERERRAVRRGTAA